MDLATEFVKFFEEQLSKLDTEKAIKKTGKYVSRRVKEEYGFDIELEFEPGNENDDLCLVFKGDGNFECDVLVLKDEDGQAEFIELLKNVAEEAKNH